MSVAIYYGKIRPMTAPFHYLVEDLTNPDGFSWVQNHDLATWYASPADARAFISTHPTVPGNVVVGYFRRSKQP